MAGGWKVGMLMRGLFCDDILCAAATVWYFVRTTTSSVFEEIER